MKKWKNPYVWGTILFLAVVLPAVASRGTFALMFYLGLLASIVILLFICYLLRDVGVKIYDGKRYTLQAVGMDTERAQNDMIKHTLHELSDNEWHRRDRTGCYAIYAYVQQGKQSYTWKEEEINRETFLRHAHDTEKLPLYLQLEAYDEIGEGLTTVGQYRKKMSPHK